jgi:hypothetical protein
LPFTLGFYIKHLLLISINNDIIYTGFILINLLGGAVFGILYSFKFFYYIFFDFKKAKKIVYNCNNQVNLNSKFYTNSSVASNLTLIFFIIVAYIIIIYLFFIFLNKNVLNNNFSVNVINSAKYDEFNFLTSNIINNIGFFN